MTICGSAVATDLETAAASRRSPVIDITSDSTRARLKSAGSVSGANANPVTFAPIAASQSAAQLPLKPVWPVRSTRLPDQKAGSGKVIPITPDFPGGLAARPQLLELHLVAQRIHRLPKTRMAEGHQLTRFGEPLQRFHFPRRFVSMNEICDRRIKHEEAAIDVGVVTRRFLHEPHDAIAVHG